MADEIPVACSLSDLELRNRQATLLAEFKSVLIGMEELDDGYVFRVPGDKRGIAIATELILAEHECCPFLAFHFSVGPGTVPAQLRVTGTNKSKEFLKEVLG